MAFNRKEKALVITIAVNLFLIALKFILAGMSGSLALKAGAWHSFSDIFVSGIVLVGLIVARKKGLEQNKGISRIENVVSLIVSIFILYIGYEIFQEVIRGEQMALTQVPAVILGALLTIAVSYFMARYKIYVGQETNSSSLVADGYHSKMDMYSSIVVVIGLVGYQIGLVNMDKVAAVVIVVLIVWAGLEIFIGAFKALRSGELPDPLHRHVLLRNGERYFRYIRWFGVPLLLVIYAASGAYYIRWDQVGIEKYFGKPIDTAVPPGLHYRLPWPVGGVDKVNVNAIVRITTAPSLMLTGDENLIEVNVGAHYEVKNAFDFRYRITAPDKLVELAAESAVRQVVSQMPVDELLTTGKAKIQSDTLRLAQETLDRAEAGIRLINLQLLQAAPPQKVISAFQDVASAKEDMVTYFNEALSYRNEVIPLSRGKAAEIMADSAGYRAEKINQARGEAKGFLERIAAYQEAPKITKTRMYIETLEKVLPQVQKLIVDSQIDIGTTDLWFLNGRSQLAGKLLKEVK